MFMLGRPPVLRWAAAFVALAVAIWVDVRPPSTVVHPFARDTIEPGQSVQPVDVDMRDVVAGTLQPVALPITVAGRIEPGDPILASDEASPERFAPTGWWNIELEMPAGAVPGTAIGVVLVDRPGAAMIEGVVTGTAADDGLGAAKAVAAFPGDTAAEVAAAAALGRVAVLTSVRDG